MNNIFYKNSLVLTNTQTTKKTKTKRNLLRVQDKFMFDRPQISLDEPIRLEMIIFTI